MRLGAIVCSQINNQDLSWFFSIGMLLAFLFAFYGIIMFCRTMSRKNSLKLPWKREHEVDLRNSAIKIYSTKASEDLKIAYLQESGDKFRYRHMIQAMFEDRKRELNLEEEAPSLCPKETRVRRVWFIAFILNYLPQILFSLLLSFAVIFVGATLDIFKLVTISIFPLFFIACPVAIYYFAYKNNGTGFLTWIIITYPMYLVLEFLGLLIITIDTLISVEEEAAIMILVLPVLVLKTCIEGFFWFCSLKLRRVNRISKGRRQLSALKELLQKTKYSVIPD